MGQMSSVGFDSQAFSGQVETLLYQDAQMYIEWFRGEA